MTLTITIHALDHSLEQWLNKEAARRGEAVEVVAQRLLERGIAMERSPFKESGYHDLDHLAGTWSTEEADAFDAAVADFDKIDEELWT